MFAALLLAIAPVAAIVWYTYVRDEYDREPLNLLLTSFLLGILSIVPAIWASNFGTNQLGINASGNILETAVFAFIVVALSEEFAKFIFLRWVMFPKKEFDEPFDGIVYAVMIGMGFAAFENVLYVYRGGLEVALLRMFTAVPAHAAFGVIMGYYVGLAKFETDRKKQTRLCLQGLFWAVMIHGAYDFFLMSSLYIGLGVLAFVILIISIYFSSRAMSIHAEMSPFNPDNIVVADANTGDGDRKPMFFYPTILEQQTTSSNQASQTENHLAQTESEINESVSRNNTSILPIQPSNNVPLYPEIPKEDDSTINHNNKEA